MGRDMGEEVVLLELMGLVQCTHSILVVGIDGEAGTGRAEVGEVLWWFRWGGGRRGLRLRLRFKIEDGRRGGGREIEGTRCVLVAVGERVADGRHGEGRRKEDA